MLPVPARLPVPWGGSGKMSTGDTWSALFDLWHKQAHDRQTLKDLGELERRIVQLEAYMKAAKLDAAERARVGL